MRVFNFGAGPSTINLDVLKDIQNELLDFNNTGMSIMEISHRGKEFMALYDELISDLRKLLNVPMDYEIFFMQGGATTQFASVALNLMTTGKADYIESGFFSSRAQVEASKYGIANIIASSKDENYRNIPICNEVSKDSSYLHICFNNTIYGTTYNYIPKVNVPVVADMSSFILSRPIDVTKFGLIYAGCQKNMGIAGNTLVIARKDLLGKEMPITPIMMNYKVLSDAKSMYNTPPVFSIYVTSKIVKHLLNNGGLENIEKINLKKAKMLYDYLDQSKVFYGVCDKEFRSITNVCFKCYNEELEGKFVEFAKERGLVGIKGHRLVGGLRASIYNGMPIDGVKALVKAMEEFEKNEI